MHGEMERWKEKGLFQLVCELALEDTAAYREMMWMHHEQFKEILQQIEPYIAKETTKFGAPISISKQLALSLSVAHTARFLSLATEILSSVVSDEK